MDFFRADTKDKPRISPIAPDSGSRFSTPDTIKDNLKHISEDVESKKTLVNIATQILETPSSVPSSSLASSSDDDKVREFLKKVQRNPEYIQLLKDITKDTIEEISNQSRNKEISYKNIILKVYQSDKKELARRYMIRANIYFKSIGDNVRARMFEGSLDDFVARARARTRASARGRHTRKSIRPLGKKTRKIKK